MNHDERMVFPPNGSIRHAQSLSVVEATFTHSPEPPCLRIEKEERTALHPSKKFASAVHFMLASNLCYTLIRMPNQPMFWDRWEERLSKWKLQNLAAEMLENGSALTLLFAQVIYLAQPLLNPEQEPELTALTRLLESPAESTAFASRLRKEQCR